MLYCKPICSLAMCSFVNIYHYAFFLIEKYFDIFEIQDLCCFFSPICLFAEFSTLNVYFNFSLITFEGTNDEHGWKHDNVRLKMTNEIHSVVRWCRKRLRLTVLLWLRRRKACSTTHLTVTHLTNTLWLSHLCPQHLAAEPHERYAPPTTATEPAQSATEIIDVGNLTTATQR